MPLYTIYYNDNTYLTYELTEKEANSIGSSMGMDTNVQTSIGWIRTSDIRSIIIQKEQEMKDNESYVPDIPVEYLEWLKSHAKAEEILEEKLPNEIVVDDDDVDYEGGMI